MGGNDGGEFHTGIMNSYTGSHGVKRNIFDEASGFVVSTQPSIGASRSSNRIRITCATRSTLFSAISHRSPIDHRSRGQRIAMSDGNESEAKKRDLHWPTVLFYIHLKALALYGAILLLTEAKWLTVLFLFTIIFIAYIGITLGAHRFWAHQTYAATGFVRLFLMLAHTLSGAGPVYHWVLKHRIHHQYYGTDKDPYNHKKGFLYSHLISNLMTESPEQERVNKSIDMRDVETDGYVWLQRKFYWPLYIIVGLLLPLNAPVEYWGESMKVAVFVLGFLRIAVTVNLSWLVNSAKIVWGLKPGDKFPPDDNSVFVLTKSHWPNYHYLLSWDYKSGEFGTYDHGCASLILSFWSSIGSISLLKTASNEAIRDALYRISTMKNVTVTEALEDVKEIAEKDAIKLKLSYQH